MPDIFFFETGDNSPMEVPIYIVGSDDFLYSTILTANQPNAPINWRKGKKQITTDGLPSGCIASANKKIYNARPSGFYVSSDLGNNWDCYPLPGFYFDSIYVYSEQIILLGASGGNSGIAVSTDGGKTWKQPSSVANIHTIGSIYACTGAKSFGGFDSLLAVAMDEGVALSTDKGTSWTYFGNDASNNDFGSPPNVLGSNVGRIFLYNSWIYLIQATGISYGKISKNPDNTVKITWETPITNISDWYYEIPGGQGRACSYVDSGKLYLYLAAQQGPQESVIRYHLDYAGKKVEDMGPAFSQGFPDVPLNAPPLLKRVAEFFFYFNTTLNVSVDSGKTFQTIVLNSPS